MRQPRKLQRGYHKHGAVYPVRFPDLEQALLESGIIHMGAWPPSKELLDRWNGEAERRLAPYRPCLSCGKQTWLRITIWDEQRVYKMTGDSRLTPLTLRLNALLDSGIKPLLYAEMTGYKVIPLDS